MRDLPTPVVECRSACAACCIAPSISSPIPLPGGGWLTHKPAGLACPQLDGLRRCRLFGHPHRPAVCTSLRPGAEMCGTSAEQALHGLAVLERLTCPD